MTNHVLSDPDLFTISECHLCKGGRGHDGAPVCEASCPSLTEPHAIVRELAALDGPILTTLFANGEYSCPMPGCRYMEATLPLQQWADPANHAPTCLWRRARALYPSEGR